MSWSRAQVAVVEGARFAPSRLGYHPQDAERLRTRVLIAMRRGRPMPDLDAMALRRHVGDAVNPSQVDGMRTLLKVWATITPLVDPVQEQQRERDEALAALSEADRASVPRWSHEQMDHVRERRFTLVGRTAVSYDEHDVDDYLDSVVVAMRRGVELPDPKFARFNSSGLRRGYDPKEVDDFLDEIAALRPEA